MKKLGKIKLNQFSKDELDRRKLNALKGGCECRATCSCACSIYGSQYPSVDTSNRSGGGGEYGY